jgi:L-ascorbate metabolism protein UlaG (beta-lactamase superfamily)
MSVRTKRFLIAVAGVLVVVVALAGGYTLRRLLGGIPSPRPAVVRYFGHSMVSVSDGTRVIVVDPFGPQVGFPQPEVKADLVLVSRSRSADLNEVRAVLGSPKVFARPGIFVLGPTDVLGLPSDVTTLGVLAGGPAPVVRDPNTIFLWTMRSIRFAHLGDLSRTTLSQSQTDLLRGVDVMFVPVGGGTALDGQAAASLVQLLAPKIAVPIHYGAGPSKMGLQGPDAFLGRLPGVRHMPSTVRLTRGKLPSSTQIWVMDWR